MKKSQLKIRKKNPIPKVKEYGIVSQWVLIYRSKDLLEVKKMVVEWNEKYWEDYLKAINAGEKPVDNELFLVEI